MSRRIRFTLRLVTLVISISVSDCQPADASETLAVVQLQSGRILSGAVDARTDASELWLHSTEPSIVVLSSVPWSEVVAARIARQAVATAELKQTLSKLKQPIPLATFRQPVVAADQLSGQQVRSRQATRVQSVEMLVSIANWDNDVEPDGLEVRIRPLTEHGETVAVNAMFTLKLLGRRSGSPERLESQSGFGFSTNGGSPRELATPASSSRYVEIGRWSERLGSHDATASGYVLRLPFRGVHPEYDLDVALDGEVDARLSIQGQKIHTLSTAIQLRRYSPLREELQLHRGTRFFPTER